MKNMKIPLAIITLNPFIGFLDVLGLTVVHGFRVVLALATIGSIVWMWLILASDEVE
jgi:hypothetical protein